MNQRRFSEARRLLAPLARDCAGQADLHFLLGAACAGASEPAAAESALSDALAIDPEHQRAAVDLARLLSAQGRHAELLDRTARAAAVDRPHEALLGERARALAAMGQGDEAVAVRRRAAALNPGKGHLLHNLAATQGDVGLNIDAESSARAALRLGDKPETWLVLARALQGQNRFDEAETAFSEATARRPMYFAALHDHAQLVWMRTGDLDEATTVLNRMTQQGVEGRPARLIKAQLMQAAGDAEGAYASLADDIRSDDIAALVMGAQLALAIDPGAALQHALRATALAPQDRAAERILINANLALGRASEALEALAEPLRRAPFDQGFIAAQWTAWRLLDDPRAAALYDYQNVVSAGMIDAPPGWISLSAYLQDLRTALLRLHGLTAHPLGQSLRHGAQTSANLLRSDDPTIRAFPAAIDAAVRRHLSFIGSGDDILRSRNTGEYRIQSMWSVRLAPHGFHTNHVHPEGWLSSACYIETPDDEEAGEHDGWLKFGEPGPTSPSLAAQRHIRPEPGLLVLFPSYMWHGTSPFRRGARMSIAFDLVPA